LIDIFRKDDPLLLSHLETNDVTMHAAFSPFLLTLFVYQTPLSLAVRLIDIFLIGMTSFLTDVDGEEYIINLIKSLVLCSKKKLFSLENIDLHDFIRKDLIKSCVESEGIKVLLDFNK
jgi:hypothetical protein